MQSTSPRIQPTGDMTTSQLESNRGQLDLDWLGQQPLAALDDRGPALLELLAQVRAELGVDDPFGAARFAPDTPVVVILRALARLARLS